MEFVGENGKLMEKGSQKKQHKQKSFLTRYTQVSSFAMNERV